MHFSFTSNGKNRYKEMISVSLPKWHSMPDFPEAEKNQDEVRHEDQEPEELNTPLTHLHWTFHLHLQTFHVKHI
jgi:hypothetical protein